MNVIKAAAVTASLVVLATGSAMGDQRTYDALGMNHESQVGAECAAQFGVGKAAAACIVGRLTDAEIRKCFRDGFRGRGCFGDNNTLVRLVHRNWKAAERESNGVNRLIRGTTGVSVRDIERHGPLGGENSEARKGCNAIAGLFGGRC